MSVDFDMSCGCDRKSPTPYELEQLRLVVARRWRPILRSRLYSEKDCDTSLARKWYGAMRVNNAPRRLVPHQSNVQLRRYPESALQGSVDILGSTRHVRTLVGKSRFPRDLALISEFSSIMARALRDLIKPGSRDSVQVRGSDRFGSWTHDLVASPFRGASTCLA